jgi:ArsR family transcriptional regulator, lead/cadmium/zinc/bismuth-responsive transcriptional repressor
MRRATESQTSNHEQGVDPAELAAVRKDLISADDAGRLAGLMGLLADPVRSRVLFALSTVERLCVSDLALALDATEDAVSYGLRMLRVAGLVTFRKEGRVVYYSLAPKFPHPLLEHCLRELLRIAAPNEDES